MEAQKTSHMNYSEKKFTQSRPRSSSQPRKRDRIFQQLGGFVGELAGNSYQSGNLGAGASSQIMQMALQLLHSYNIRTDAKGGLTDQILNAVESLLVSGLDSDDFAQKAERVVKVLLTAYAVKSMRNKPEEGADSSSRKLARSMKAIAMGVLAKKVVDDLLNKKSPSASKASKTQQITNLLMTTLGKQVSRGEGQATGLESDPKYGPLMLKAKSLAKDMLTKKSENGLPSDEVSSKGNYVDMIKLFADQMIRDESSNAFLVSKASKYGIDGRIAIQAKEV